MSCSAINHHTVCHPWTTLVLHAVSNCHEQVVPQLVQIHLIVRHFPIVENPSSHPGRAPRR
jgi:hypothetical protein